MTSYVVDTNVGVVANSINGEHCPECVKNCTDRLRKIVRDGKIVLDDKDLILKEYFRHLSPNGARGVGDFFMKWVFQYQRNPNKSEIVVISPTNGSFEEFPDHNDLLAFDNDDHKFVVVALGSRNNPRVQNATDSDWWNFKDALENEGILIDFLCPLLFRGRQLP